MKTIAGRAPEFAVGDESPGAGDFEQAEAAERARAVTEQTNGAEIINAPVTAKYFPCASQCKARG